MKGLTRDDRHVYWFKDRPVISVTQAMKLAGLSRWIDRVPAYAIEFGRDRGTAVHKAIELQIKGTLDYDSIDPRISGYLDAFNKFKTECSFRPHKKTVERMFIAESGRYAGQIDVEGSLQGRPCVIDWKSGLLVETAMIQMTAYCRHSSRMQEREPLVVGLEPEGRYKIFTPDRHLLKYYRAVWDNVLGVAEFRLRSEPRCAPWHSESTEF